MLPKTLKSNQPWACSTRRSSQSHGSVGWRGKFVGFHRRPRSSTSTLAPAVARRNAFTAPRNPLPTMTTSKSITIEPSVLHPRAGGAVDVPELAHEQAAEAAERLQLGGNRRAVSAERRHLLQEVEELDADDPG